jgi:hypothetical protein
MRTPLSFGVRPGVVALIATLLTTPSVPYAAAIDPTTDSIPWRLGYDLAVDEVGRIEQRTIADLAEARCVWWVSGNTVLVQERPAPAGMVEETYVPHNPLSDAEQRIGISAGPLVFGPVRPRGGFRRAIDPTTGGVVSSAVGEPNGLALDSSLEPSTWSGVGVSLVRSSEVLHGGAIRMGYLTSPDRANLVIGSVELSPWRGRWGGVSIIAARSEPLDEGRPIEFDPSEESWITPTTPVRNGTTTRVGAAYLLDRGGYNDPTGSVRVPVDLLIEGWREGESYDIRRHAGGGALSIGPRRLRVATRGILVETGFLDIEGTPPIRFSYVGGRVEGISRRLNLRRRRPQPGGLHSRRPLRPPRSRPRRAPNRYIEFQWRGEIDRAQGWDDGTPDVAEWEHRYRCGIESNGVLRRIALEYEAPLAFDEGGGESGGAASAASISSAVRVVVPIGATPVFTATGDISFATTPGFTDRNVSSEIAVSRRTRNDQRGTLLWRLRGDEESKRGEGQDAPWVWSHTWGISVPLGTTAEIEGRCTISEYGTAEEEITGSIRFRWYRSGELPREMPPELPPESPPESRRRLPASETED